MKMRDVKQDGTVADLLPQRPSRPLPATIHLALTAEKCGVLPWVTTQVLRVNLDPPRGKSTAGTGVKMVVFIHLLKLHEEN